MSLINDALKRASAVPPQPPPPGLNYRPVEPEQQATRGIGLLLPAVFAVIALLGLFFVWQVSQRRTSTGKSKTPIALGKPAPRPAALQPAPAQVPGPAPVVATAAPEPVATPLPPPKAVEPPAPAPTLAATNASLSEKPTPTNAQAAVAEPPKPPPLKLQSIVFNPRRPSAMINGRPLFLGDAIGQYRVVAISRDSAMLVSAGQTNILTLP